MKIKSITIKNYKSIKEINLDLTDGFSPTAPYTFIGKNGSGKSNILEAIANIFRIKVSKDYYSDMSGITNNSYGFEGRDCGFTLQLDAQETEEYGDVVALRPNGEIFFGGKGNFVDYIGDREKKYPLDKYLNEISKHKRAYDSLFEKLQSALREAEDYMISCFPYSRDPFLEIENYCSGSADDLIQTLRDDYRREPDAADFFKNLRKARVTPTEFLRNAGMIVPYLPDLDLRKHAFKIRDLGILSPTVERSLDKGEAERIRATHRQKTEELTDRIGGLLNELTDAALSVTKVVKQGIEDFNGYREEYEQSRRGSFDKYEKFITKVQETVGNVYFLDYETAMNFTDGNRYDRYEKVWTNLRFSDPEGVIENFLVKNGLLKSGETVFGVGQKPSSDRLRQMQDRINNELFRNILPDFDRDEVNGLEINFTEAEKRIECELFVKEKSGHKTPFHQTSLGRRWYICYMLIAGVLKRGDFLILDEPASTLQPAATEEIRQKLNGCAQRGVHVFVSTHNPYMFPDNFENIINVKMTEEGTVACAVKSSGRSAEEMRRLEKLVAADLLFRLNEKTILVEGKSDEACIKKFAELLGYDLSRVRFHICDGDAILQMTKLCKELNVNFVALLDNDNKFKDEEYKKRHTEYEKIIEEIISDKKHRVFVGEGEDGKIEDLFEGKDFDKYCPLARYNGQRKLNVNSLKKITSLEDCEKQTLENFENILNKLGLKKLNT